LLLQLLNGQGSKIQVMLLLHVVTLLFVWVNCISVSVADIEAFCYYSCSSLWFTSIFVTPLFLLCCSVWGIKMQAAKRVIGRGCDPARAAFASKQWSEILGCQVITTTDDETLYKKLKEGPPYDVFFMAPGLCQLDACGVYNGKKLKEDVAKLNPGIKIIEITDVAKGLSMISEAINGKQVTDVKPSTEAWPFVD
jgi:hypothetical protein